MFLKKCTKSLFDKSKNNALVEYDNFSKTSGNLWYYRDEPNNTLGHSEAPATNQFRRKFESTKKYNYIFHSLRSRRNNFIQGTARVL